ncbi:hypothetical protein ABZV14_16890 [Streptosporangium canum]|uniref:hypothetical protein n=1 Tax=Streptosporangium canum TaxID=324952 RepID=UPI0033AB798C
MPSLPYRRIPAEPLHGRVEGVVDQERAVAGLGLVAVVEVEGEAVVDADRREWPGGRADLPAYTGRLHAEEVPRPLEVRFWITSPAQGSRSVAAPRRGTEQRGGRRTPAIAPVLSRAT